MLHLRRLGVHRGIVNDNYSHWQQGRLSFLWTLPKFLDASRTCTRGGRTLAFAPKTAVSQLTEGCGCSKRRHACRFACVNLCVVGWMRGRVPWPYPSRPPKEQPPRKLSGKMDRATSSGTLESVCRRLSANHRRGKHRFRIEPASSLSGFPTEGAWSKGPDIGRCHAVSGNR